MSSSSSESELARSQPARRSFSKRVSVVTSSDDDDDDGGGGGGARAGREHGDGGELAAAAAHSGRRRPLPRRAASSSPPTADDTSESDDSAPVVAAASLRGENLSLLLQESQRFQARASSRGSSSSRSSGRLRARDDATRERRERLSSELGAARPPRTSGLDIDLSSSDDADTAARPSTEQQKQRLPPRHRRRRSKNTIASSEAEADDEAAAWSGELQPPMCDSWEPLEKGDIWVDIVQLGQLTAAGGDAAGDEGADDDWKCTRNPLGPLGASANHPHSAR